MTRHFFEDIADHLGRAYLRYSFTKGTEQEVAFLVDVLELAAGSSVLDVGCGPGRHAHALARRGIAVTGVDISARFVAIATEDAPAGSACTFRRLDARTLDYDASFDAAISLCQGAFGLVGPGDDEAVLAGMAAAVRPGGRIALSAFSSYFQVRYPQDDGTFDARTGIHHERTSVKDEGGTPSEADLWTTCYTPRELELLVDRAGLVTEAIWSVEPGRYRKEPAGVESPEHLVIARKP